MARAEARKATAVRLHLLVTYMMMVGIEKYLCCCFSELTRCCEIVLEKLLKRHALLVAADGEINETCPNPVNDDVMVAKKSVSGIDKELHAQATRKEAAHS